MATMWTNLVNKMLSGRNQSKRPYTVGSVYMNCPEQANPERERERKQIGGYLGLGWRGKGKWV